MSLACLLLKAIGQTKEINDVKVVTVELFEVVKEH